MLTIENTEAFGWEAAIRGARNPMNSWEKSDSKWDGYGDADGYSVGNADLRLMKNLADAGSDHGKCLRFINVTVDITAPLYWWKEFKTYRVGRKFLDDGDEILDPEEFEMFVETNSCSTMHKIHSKEFTMDDFSHEHLETIDDCYINFDGVLDFVVDALNTARERYIETKDKRYWWQMIQLLPSSYNQKRTVQLNYHTLRRMYYARKHHKLDEWITFCDWIKTLPYAKELIIGEE